MTKARKQEQTEAIAKLREWLKPGDTVYTILEHVSSSGMSRSIRVLVPYTRRAATATRQDGTTTADTPSIIGGCNS